MQKPHIIIVGGGFGGVYTAKYLAPAVQKNLCRITLISQENYFLFTPLLHEVATGSLSANSIIEPLRDIFAGSGVEVVQARVEAVDEQQKTISLALGERLSYDMLVLATGAQTAYYGVTGASEYSLPLKTLQDAIRLRTQMIERFEQASKEPDPERRREWLSFVVVGGGPTSIELVAEMREFADILCKSHMRTFDDVTKEDVTITLVSAADELLTMFHPRIRGVAHEVLGSLRITCLLGQTVSEVTSHGITCKGGTTIPSRTVVWAAGVTADIACAKHFSVNKGRIVVDEFLRATMPDVFVLGDAACTNAVSGDAPAPMLAQIAVDEAKTCAYNICAALQGKALKPYRVTLRGMLVSLGAWRAAGQIGPLDVRGPFAWFVWRTVYLFKFASWKKRWRIMFEWTYALFSSRDTSHVI